MASPYTTVINIAVSKEFLKKLDKAAFSEYMTRSAYIRQAVAEKLSAPPPTPNHWLIVEAFADTMSDEELARAVRRLKNWSKS